jgi:hypothetical protein
VFADLLAAVDGLTARKAAIAHRISELATDGPWWPTVARLRAFRGIDTLTALSIHLELGGDWRRFERPTSLSAWLGLTPSLSQSGQSSRQGAITKTGSMLARRLLVEAAWPSSREPRLGATLANRQLGQPDHILQISNHAQQRLHHVHKTMRARARRPGPPTNPNVRQADAITHARLTNTTPYQKAKLIGSWGRPATRRATAGAEYQEPTTKRMIGPKLWAAAAPMKCRPGTEDSRPGPSTG